MTDDFRAWAAGLPAMPGEVRAVPGDVAEIVIDDPRTRNALHPGMMVGLADAVDAVRGARVVLLRGEGGTFCSGGNLGAVRQHLVRPGGGHALGAFMQATVGALADLDAVVVGVATGNALGGGAELLSACDRVFAAPDARIGWVQAKMGVSPGFGGGQRLVRRVGPRRALELLLAPAPLSAAEALVAGLVEQVADEPLAAARAWADRVAALDPDVLRGAKAVVRAHASLPAPDALAVELAVFDRLWGGPAHLAALRR